MICKSLICIALITVFTVSGQYSQNTSINYASTTPGNFCPSQPPAGLQQSPIAFESTLCAPYNSFSLNLTNVNGGTLNPSNTYWNSMLTYPGGNLEFNGVSYTSQAIGLHYQSENQLPLGQADMEMQIYFTNQVNGTTNLAVVSFQLVSTNSSSSQAVNNGRNASWVTFGDLVTATPGANPQFNFNLAKITNAINQKASNNLYLNFYQYFGTPNFPIDSNTNCNVTWLVYGSQISLDPHVITAFSEYVLPELASTYQSNSAFELNQVDDQWQNKIYSNSLNPAVYNQGVTPTYVKLCYTGYFQVTLGSDSALWYSIFLTLLYFIFSLSMDEKPNKLHDFEQNHWTAHPIYSIIHVGNDIFTRKSRLTSIYVTMINIYLWSSYLALNAYNNGQQGNVLIFALGSLPISWVSSYIIGCFLRQYYKKKYEAEKDKSDNEDDRAQFNIYIYYFLCVIFFCVGFPLTIANLYGLNQTSAGAAIVSTWGGSVFLAAAFEWLIFDTLVTLIASKVEGLFNWVKTRGFVYDELCHETYKFSIKKD